MPNVSTCVSLSIIALLFIGAGCAGTEKKVPDPTSVAENQPVVQEKEKNPEPVTSTPITDANSEPKEKSEPKTAAVKTKTVVETKTKVEAAVPAPVKPKSEPAKTESAPTPQPETKPEPTPTPEPPAPKPVIKEFTMTAKNWDFVPSTITVKKGDTVRLHIKSVDVDHGFNLSAFNVKVMLKPNETVTAEFVADKVGNHSFFCSVFCGSGHQSMKGTLVVEE